MCMYYIILYRHIPGTVNNDYGFDLKKNIYINNKKNIYI